MMAENPFSAPPVEQQSEIDVQHARDRKIERAWTCGLAYGLVAGLVMSTELWGFLMSLFGR